MREMAPSTSLSSDGLTEASEEDVRLSPALEELLREACADRLGRVPNDTDFRDYREFLIRITLLAQSIVRRQAQFPSPTPLCRVSPSTLENHPNPTISKRKASTTNSRGRDRAVQKKNVNVIRRSTKKLAPLVSPAVRNLAD